MHKCKCIQIGILNSQSSAEPLLNRRWHHHINLWTLPNLCWKHFLVFLSSHYLKLHQYQVSFFHYIFIFWHRHSVVTFLQRVNWQRNYSSHWNNPDQRSTRKLSELISCGGSHHLCLSELHQDLLVVIRPLHPDRRRNYFQCHLSREQSRSASLGHWLESEKEQGRREIEREGRDNGVLAWFGV